MYLKINISPPEKNTTFIPYTPIKSGLKRKICFKRLPPLHPPLKKKNNRSRKIVFFFLFQRPSKWDWCTRNTRTGPSCPSCPPAVWPTSCRTRSNCRRCCSSWPRGRSSSSCTYSSGSSCTSPSATHPGPRARPIAGTPRA